MSEEPYPGLRPFQRDETDIFFGRDEHVTQLLEKLERSRFVAVIGTSGCGKSSLLEAGLIAALETGFLTSTGTRWRVAKMKPGTSPLRRLAWALLDAGCGQTSMEEHDVYASLLATLRRGPLGLRDVLRETSLPLRTNLLVLVDQFEEIFRYRQEGGGEESSAFVALLLATAARRDVPVYVVIALRSDFLGDCAVFSGLPEAINESPFLTPRLTRDQRQAAIVGPARVFAADVEPRLVSRLLNDMGTDPDQLPVMQHSLMRLWERATTRSGRPGTFDAPEVATPAERGKSDIVLTLEDYEKLGRLDEALSEHADEAFNELDPSQKRTAELMFRALTDRRTGRRDTRRPQPAQAVADVASVSLDHLESVVEIFRRSGRSFLTVSVEDARLGGRESRTEADGTAEASVTPEAMLDISHESLIRQWRRLSEWVDAEARLADQYRFLQQTAYRWKNEFGQREEALWGSPHLDVALEWLARDRPTPEWASRYEHHEGDFELVKEFLAASEQHRANKELSRREVDARERQRELKQAREALTKKLLRSLAIALLLGVVVAVSGWVIADSQLTSIESARLGGAGLSLLADGKIERGLLVSLEAYHRRDTPEARAGLGAVLTTNRHKTIRLEEKLPAQPTAMVLSPDRSKLAALGKDDSLVLVDLTANPPTSQPLSRHGVSIRTLAFSADGALAAGGCQTVVKKDRCAEGGLLLWRDGVGEVRHLRGHKDEIRSVAFGAGGHSLVSGSEDGSILVWDLSETKPRTREPLAHGAPVVSIAMASDGTLASAGCREWDKQENRCKTGGLHLWKNAAGPPIELIGHTNLVRSLAFSPDASFLASGGEENQLRVWDLSSRPPRSRELRGHVNSIVTLAFSEDGKTLTSGSTDRSIINWKLQAGMPTAAPPFQSLTGHGAPVTSAVVSPTGDEVVSASEDRTVKVWDARPVSLRKANTPSTLKAPQGPHSEQVLSLALSPDGARMASGGQDKALVLWDTRSGTTRVLGSHVDSVYSVAFTTDGKTLASGGCGKLEGPQRCGKGQIQLWDPISPAPSPRLIEGHKAPVLSLAFRPLAGKGKVLASGGGDHAIIFWDLAGAEGVVRTQWDAESSVTSLAFRPDGRVLASGGVDNKIVLWSVDDSGNVKRLPRPPLDRHRGEVSSLAFSPDGKILASGGRDSAIFLWDTYTGQPLSARLAGHPNAVVSLEFSSDGRSLTSRSVDHTTLEWEVSPEAWKEHACRIAGRNLQQQEWTDHVSRVLPYRRACPNLGPGDGAPHDTWWRSVWSLVLGFAPVRAWNSYWES